MSGVRTSTTADLCARLADVPQATVYRHVSLLAEAGVLEVASEERVQGAVERHYRLQRKRALIDRRAAAAMTRDDHRRGFTAAMAVLLAEFNSYLDRKRADPTADMVSYRQFPFWLSHDELADLIRDITNVVASRMKNEPAPGRHPHLLSTILFPIEEKKPARKKRRVE